MKLEFDERLYNNGLIPHTPVSRFIKVSDSSSVLEEDYESFSMSENIVFYGDIVGCIDKLFWINPRLIADANYISTVVNIDNHKDALTLVDPIQGYLSNSFICMLSKADNRMWMNILKNHYNGLCSIIINHSSAAIIQQIYNTIISHEISCSRIFYNSDLVNLKDSNIGNKIFPIHSLPIL